MKKLIVFLLLVISSQSYSQTQQKDILDCDDLNTIFSNPDFANYYEAYIKDTVLFVDTFRVFRRCNNLLIKGHPVVFLDKFTKEISRGDQSAEYFIKQRRTNPIPFTKRYIVVELFKKEKGRRYNLSFWQPQNNVSWRFYLYKRKRIKIKIYEKGQY